jgi:uncharacterized protein (DUF1778 family)
LPTLGGPEKPRCWPHGKSQGGQLADLPFVDRWLKAEVQLIESLHVMAISRVLVSEVADQRPWLWTNPRQERRPEVTSRRPSNGSNAEAVKTTSLRRDILLCKDLMPVTQRAGTRREAINIRIKPQVRELIDRAAELAGKNRTDFVLDAARRAAEDTLLDRTVLTVSANAYRQFLARLDAPPRPNKRLLKSMRTRAPWE